MGVVIGEQLGALWRSLLLGAGLALLYDALRALRRRLRCRALLTPALDTLYSLVLLAALAAYAQRVGMGELRLYALLTAALGGTLTFLLLSPLLRPLWDFWADCLAAVLRLLHAPLLCVKKYYGKLHKLAKKHFLFLRRSLIIEDYRHTARHARRAAERKGGAAHGKKGAKDTTHSRTARAAADPSPAAPRRCAPPDAPTEDRRGASGDGLAQHAGRGAAAGE